MSDDVLKIIPKNPDFVPPAGTHEAAVRELQRLTEGETCEAEVYETIAFIDPGENLEAVVCPKCGQKTQFDYFTDDDPGCTWWYELAERLEETPPSELHSTMPCCGNTVKMIDLTFDWPAGFARFELSIWNPDRATNLDAQQLARLESILGCELRQVRAHY
jgi:hypothetical protein